MHRLLEQGEKQQRVEDYERVADGKQKPMKKDLNYEECSACQDRTVQDRDDYLQGVITGGKAMGIIDALQ